MNAPHKPTKYSTDYRRKASALARDADTEASLEKQIELVGQAMQWLQLAENEEYLVEATQAATIVDFPGSH